MKTGSEEDQNDLESTQLGDMFDPDNIEYDEDEDDNDDFLEGLDGDDAPDVQTEEREEEQNDEDEDEEEDENFLNAEEEQEKEEESKFTDDDLELFNKKLNTDFKSTEELAAYMNKEEAKDTIDNDADELEKANNAIDFYEPLLKLDDESLMRKQLETVALQNKQDLNDEDVQIQIEEDLNNLKDAYVLDIKAEALRNKLAGFNEKAIENKKAIEGKRAQAEETLKQTNKEQLQSAFLEIGKTESFYGVDLDKKSISDSYKDVASGKFIDLITTDKKVQAELALMYANREQIYKAASGLKYGDGMKAVLDEFKNKKEARNVSRAQRSGGSGGSEKSMAGLIADVLYTKPEKEK